MGECEAIIVKRFGEVIPLRKRYINAVHPSICGTYRDNECNIKALVVWRKALTTGVFRWWRKTTNTAVVTAAPDTAATVRTTPIVSLKARKSTLRGIQAVRPGLDQNSIGHRLHWWEPKMTWIKFWEKTHQINESQVKAKTAPTLALTCLTCCPQGGATGASGLNEQIQKQLLLKSNNHPELSHALTSYMDTWTPFKHY